MNTLERLQKAVSHGRHGSMLLDIYSHRHGPTLPVISLSLYDTGRDFEDGHPMACGDGPSLEAALVNLLANMGAP